MLNLRDKIQNLQNTHILVDNMYEISILSSVSTYSGVGWTLSDLKGGDFNFSGTHAWKAEVPPTRNFVLRIFYRIALSTEPEVRVMSYVLCSHS